MSKQVLTEAQKSHFDVIHACLTGSSKDSDAFIAALKEVNKANIDVDSVLLEHYGYTTKCS